MIDSIRPCVAFLSAVLISHNYSYKRIYDYSKKHFSAYHVNINKERISVYDYDRKCIISGKSPYFYDYGIKKYVQCNLSGLEVNGFDYETRSFFKVSIIGSSLSFYDYGTHQYYNYRVL